MDKKQIVLRLPEDKMARLKEMAESSGQSANAFVEKLIDQAAGVVPEGQKIGASGKLRIQFTDKEIERLNEKAAELNVTPTQFIKDCINKKSMAKISVVTADLDDLLDAMYVMTRHLNGLLNPIMRAGAFKADVDRILKLHTELNDTVNRIYMEQVSMREQIYSETKRMVLEEVKDQKHIKRKRVKS